MTYHRIIDETRYSKRRVSLEATQWLEQKAEPAFPSLENQMMFKQILDAIQNELTNDQRHVVILRFLEGFSLRETGAIIGKSKDNVKVIQSRAIAKLRQAAQYNDNRSVAS
jgi:RNA polymerase sigma factor (sigma-70 family)